VTRFLVATFLALVVLAGVGVGVARLVGASDSKPTGSNQVRGEPTRSKALLTPIVRAPMLRPRILVRAGYVGAFAQDGPRIAWLDPYARCSPVRVRNLRTGEDRPLLRTPRGCEEGFVCGPCSLALAGKRALWEESSGGSNSETDGEVVTAALDDRVKRDVCDFAVSGGSSYFPKVWMAGDGQTLAFLMKDDPIDPGAPACLTVRSVDPRGRVSRIRGTASSTLVAVGDARLALAAQTSDGGCVCNSHLAWSPDGTRIAFTNWRSGRDEIYVVNADGTGERRLGSGDSPDWSPDGTKIVFERQRGANPSEIVVVNANGTGERVLGSGFDARWSPKRSEIAFDDPYKIHVVNADGSGDRTLAGGDREPNNRVPLRPVWSPDGSWLAFAGRAWHISVVNRDGSRLRTFGRPTPAALSVTWSPDGTHLAYAANNPDAGAGVNVHVVNADGSGDHALTEPGRADGGLAWSPDGRHIAFLRGSSVSSADGSLIDPRLWIMNADGTGQKQLTSSRADEDSPVWSPDGKWIAFSRGEIYAIRADGSAETQLTTTRAVGPRSSAELRVARRGRLVATVAAPGRVTAVALSHSTLALLVDVPSGQRIELFDARTTVARGTFSAPRYTAPELSVAGMNVVFRAGKTIYLLNGRRRSERILASAGSTPIGLSIEGRRVAWAESVGYRGRIRAIFLPRR